MVLCLRPVRVYLIKITLVLDWFLYHGLCLLIIQFSCFWTDGMHERFGIPASEDDTELKNTGFQS